MASVFLSYDREDAATAGAVARALEKAGHSVWWDLHIKGGAEYGREIEVALEQSDAVLVLWSKNSIASPWVRDEAAAGRDGGRLIPVLIQPVTPPMGFRQYQNLDFSKWKGRGKPPHMADLLSAIDALSSAGSGQRTPAEPEHKPIKTPRGPMPRWLLIGGAIMLALLILGPLLGLMLSKGGKSHVSTVAVAAANSDANPLARDLLVNLGRLQSAKSGSVRLVSGIDGSNAKPDLIFESATDSSNGQAGASIVLMDGDDRAVLWSKDFPAQASLADLKMQIAFTAARVMSCALDGLQAKGDLNQQQLKLYLNACSELTELAGSDPRPLLPALETVTRKAPEFAPAWSLLLLAQSEASVVNSTSGVEDPNVRGKLRRLIEEARSRHPDLPEIRLAEIMLLPAHDFLSAVRLVDEAKRQSPDVSWVLSTRSSILRSVGRNLEGIDDARRAAELDPLSPAALTAYASALAYSGKTEAAKDQIGKAQRLWPGSATVEDMQYRFDLRFGDAKAALSAAKAKGFGEGMELYLRARAEPTRTNIHALSAYTIPRMKDPGTVSFGAQALAEFNLVDEIYQVVLNWPRPQEMAKLGDIWFRPAFDRFRRDRRFMLLAKKIGLLDYWRDSGNWPDFCSEPDLPYDCKAEAAKVGA